MVLQLRILLCALELIFLCMSMWVYVYRDVYMCLCIYDFTFIPVLEYFFNWSIVVLQCCVVSAVQQSQSAVCLCIYNTLS